MCEVPDSNSTCTRFCRNSGLARGAFCIRACVETVLECVLPNDWLPPLVLKAMENKATVEKAKKVSHVQCQRGSSGTFSCTHVLLAK